MTGNAYTFLNLRRNNMKYVMSIILTAMLLLSLYAETSPGIAVYTRIGCGRCVKTISYLRSHNIPYAEYPIEEEKNYNDLCEIIGRIVKQNNAVVRTPVIIRDGTVYYNIDDLDAFLNSL
jgi:glutaredoxin